MPLWLNIAAILAGLALAAYEWKRGRRHGLGPFVTYCVALLLLVLYSAVGGNSTLVMTGLLGVLIGAYVWTRAATRQHARRGRSGVV